ncbi:ankyrin repeat domain-containing protein [Dyella sp. Tek66A03]|uniref:ankyrin repeat domain-containing protein n=1 Tax=Dyella sp. Tek66A03 TaxID=3458298 RepID=UPI00403EA578
MREFQTVDDVLDVVWGIVEFADYQERPSVNSIGIFGSTPLFAPITWGNVNAVRLLLEAGADCNVQRERGETALHHAIRMGKFEIARLLLAHSADPNIKDIEGKRSYDCCWEGEWDGIFGPNFTPSANSN